MRISKSKLLTSKASLLLLYIVYFCAFQFLYQNWIVSIFGYQGYEDNLNISYFVFLCIAIGSLVFYAKNDRSPSSFFIHFTIVTVFVPSAVLFVGQSKGVEFISTTFLSIFLIVSVLRFTNLKSFKMNDVDAVQLVNVLAIISVGSLLGIILFSGFGYLNFDFSKIYDLRRDAQEDLPGVFGYINSAATKIAIPFGLILATIQRRRVMVGIFALSSVMFFGFTQNKSPVFTPLVVLFVYYIAKSPKLKVYFLASSILIIFLSAVDFWLLDLNDPPEIAGWFGSLFARRSLLVPSLLNYDYIDFFLEKEKYYWAASKISFGLVTPPYDVAAPQMIGFAYYGGIETSANSGWIGSGFANAGYFGVALYSYLIALIFALFDAYARKIGSRIVIALFLIPVFTMMSSTDLATVFVSHGLLYGLLILMLIRPHQGIANNISK